MKSDVMHSRVQMEPAILEQLVTEVKETVATEVELTKEPKSNFGIVNLWNIRRTRNYAGKPRQKATIKTGISY